MRFPVPDSCAHSVSPQVTVMSNPANQNPPEVVALVVFGGDAPDHQAVARLDRSMPLLVIAADSGAEHAVALGLDIAIAVGDFDSIDADLLSRLEADGTTIERHPPTKDATDLELAIDVAIREGATTVILIGGHGGRVDQSYGNLLVLASPAYAAVSMHGLIGGARISVANPDRPVVFGGDVGEYVTLLPIHGDAHGITTTGLEYALAGDSLLSGTTRGVSNVFVGPEASVSVTAGVVIVVRPGPELPAEPSRPDSPSDESRDQGTE
ncbi:MAG: thiamine diphosphokinase [Actinobacteria bacterium]|nr:thiamine diphosphokinase [Actinomycetota bacterium]